MSIATSYLNYLGQAVLGSSASKAANHYVAGSQTNLLTGSDLLANALRGNGHSTMVGGAGDDTYYVYTNDKVVDTTGGVDTVVVNLNSAAYVLPNTIENLTVTGWNATGIGNGLSNLIVSSGTGAVTLDGKGGNDVMVGGTSADTFVVNQDYGHTVIYNFDTNLDQIRLNSFNFTSFDALKSKMTQVGKDVVLTLDANDNITLRDTSISKLSVKNFQMSIDTSSMKMTFDDEFSTFTSSADGSKGWMTKFPYGGIAARTLPSNNETEYYSDSSVGVNPFTNKDGILTITAAPAHAGETPAGSNLTYTSGLMTTYHSFSQLYGYFEVKAQLPSGAGFWPAFWLLPADNTWPPELDVFEQLGGSTIYQSVHTNVGKFNDHTSIVTNVQTATSEYHVYGVDWEPNYITYYVDGVAVGQLATPADMNKPMYMLLNLAVGGTGSWPGAADGVTSAQMKIDYVRAYASTNTPNATGNANTNSTPVKTAPVAVDPTANADKYTAAGVLKVLAADGVLANDADHNNLSLSASLATKTAHGTVVLKSDGSFVYTADTGFAGHDTFSYVASDSLSQAKPTSVDITVVASVSGDGLTGTYNLSKFDVGTGVAYSAGRGDKTIDTGTGNAQIDLGSGNDKVHLGSGTNEVTFGTGISTIAAGKGADTFIFDAKAMAAPHAAGLMNSIIYFAGEDRATNVHDTIVLKGFDAGSTLQLHGVGGRASQIYDVVGADGHIEGMFNITVNKNSDGTYHNLVAGHDYFFA